MTGDDPPFLSVGTEVSAKYRGAFCEAKVKKAIKSIKCKVFIKDAQSSLIVTDEAVKGSLRAGLTVEVKDPESGQYVEAVITKLSDCSTYTVVFDDGDERTLRRTKLCLKGEKHFIESETLDNLPLSNPEHFGTPVMQSKKGKRQRNSLSGGFDDSSESESEAESPKRQTYRGRFQELVGKIMVVDVGDKKKSLLTPVLVVLPDAQLASDLKPKDHIVVKSFKDSKLSAVARKDLKEFTREVAIKNEDKTLKTAMEKALYFLDSHELPPTWDKEDLLGSDGDDDFGDDESSDDEQSEEKDRFVAQLYKFMDDRGTPINKGPAIASKDLNLYRLFKVVQNIGGYNRVTSQMKWSLVYSKMGLPASNTASSQIKNAYKKYLHAFEDFYRKLGSTMGTVSRPGRNRHNSGRSILAFRDRDKDLIRSPKSPSVKAKDDDKSKAQKPEATETITKARQLDFESESEADSTTSEARVTPRREKLDRSAKKEETKSALRKDEAKPPVKKEEIIKVETPKIEKEEESKKKGRKEKDKSDEVKDDLIQDATPLNKDSKKEDEDTELKKRGRKKSARIEELKKDLEEKFEESGKKDEKKGSKDEPKKDGKQEVKKDEKDMKKDEKVENKKDDKKDIKKDEKKEVKKEEKKEVKKDEKKEIKKDSKKEVKSDEKKDVQKQDKKVMNKEEKEVVKKEEKKDEKKITKREIKKDLKKDEKKELKKDEKSEAKKEEISAKVDTKKDIKKDDAKKETKKIESKKDTKKDEVKKDLKKDEVKKDSKKVEVKKDTKKDELKKEEIKREVKKADVKKETKRMEPKKEFKKDAKKDLKKDEIINDDDTVKKEEKKELKEETKDVRKDDKESGKEVKELRADGLKKDERKEEKVGKKDEKKEERKTEKKEMRKTKPSVGNIDNEEQTDSGSGEGVSEDGSRKDDTEEAVSLPRSETIRSKHDEYPLGTKLKIKYGRGRNQKIYEAKVTDIGVEGSQKQYRVHYAGWNPRYDEWIRAERILSVVYIPDKSKLQKRKLSPSLSKGIFPWKKKAKLTTTQPSEGKVKKLSTPAGNGEQPRRTRSNSVEVPIVDKLPVKHRKTRSRGGITETQSQDNEESSSENDHSEIASNIEVESVITESDRGDMRYDSDRETWDEPETEESLNQEQLEESIDSLSKPQESDILSDKSNSDELTALEESVPVMNETPIAKLEIPECTLEKESIILPNAVETTEMPKDTSTSDVTKKTIDVFKWEDEDSNLECFKTLCNSSKLLHKMEVKTDTEPSLDVEFKSNVVTPLVKNIEPMSQENETACKSFEAVVLEKDKLQQFDKMPIPQKLLSEVSEAQDYKSISPIGLTECNTEEKSIPQAVPDLEKNEPLRLSLFPDVSPPQLIKPSLEVSALFQQETKSDQEDDPFPTLTILEEKTEEVVKEKRGRKKKKETKKCRKISLESGVLSSHKDHVMKIENVINAVVENQCDNQAENSMEKETEKKKVKKKVKKKDSGNFEEDEESPDKLAITKSAKHKNSARKDFKKGMASATCSVPKMFKTKVKRPLKSQTRSVSSDSVHQTKRLGKRIKSSHNVGPDDSKYDFDSSLNSSANDNGSNSDNANVSNTVFENTPPTTPENVTDMLDHDKRPSSSRQRDEYDFPSSENSQASENELPFGGGYSAMFGGEVRRPTVIKLDITETSVHSSKRKSDSDHSHTKKRRKRLLSAKSKAEKSKHHVATDSDSSNSKDGCKSPEHFSSTTTGSDVGSDSLLIAKTERSPRYNLNLDEGNSLEGEERINFLMNKIQDIRRAYMQLKSEVASIDRRRKRARRKDRESSQTSSVEVDVS